MLGIDVPNDWLDRTRRPVLRQIGVMARRPDANPVAKFLCMVVAAVAFIDVDALDFDLGQHRPVRKITVPECGGRRDCRAAPWLAARIGRPPLSRGQAFGLGGREPPPTPCSRTHKELWLYPCRYIRSTQRTAHRPCGRKRFSGSEALLAGGTEYYRDRCNRRRYLASWLQFARLRVDLELHDGVALLLATYSH